VPPTGRASVRRGCCVSTCRPVAVGHRIDDTTLAILQDDDVTGVSQVRLELGDDDMAPRFDEPREPSQTAPGRSRWSSRRGNSPTTWGSLSSKPLFSGRAAGAGINSRAGRPLGRCRKKAQTWRSSGRIGSGNQPPELHAFGLLVSVSVLAETPLFTQAPPVLVGVRDLCARLFTRKEVAHEGYLVPGSLYRSHS